MSALHSDVMIQYNTPSPPPVSYPVVAHGSDTTIIKEEMPTVETKKRKQDRNRISAANSRARKREHTEELEKQVAFLIEQNGRLSSDNDALQLGCRQMQLTLQQQQQTIQQLQIQLDSLQQTKPLALTSDAQLVLQEVEDMLMGEDIEDVTRPAVGVEDELDVTQLYELLPPKVTDAPSTTLATYEDDEHARLVVNRQLRALLTGIAFVKMWADSEPSKLLTLSSGINSADCMQLKMYWDNLAQFDPKALDILLSFASMQSHAHPGWECMHKLYSGFAEMREKMEMRQMGGGTLNGLHVGSQIPVF